MVSCPQCDANIDAEEDELDEGDTLSCDECGATVRVAGLHPLELESGDDDKEEEEEAFDGDEEDDEDEEEEDEEEDEW